MVLYLGLNYLEQAVSEKRILLEKCLIVIPQHLDHVEGYIHKGTLPNDKYRFPWKRAKKDDEFLIQESVNLLSDAQLLVDKDTNISDVVSFTSQQGNVNTCLSECVNFDLDCDVIPSSNPSTQDLFSPDEFFTEQNLFQELFEKENLKNFTSDCEHLKIESTENIEENCIVTPLQTAPDVLHLASNLKSFHVKDPFLQETGNPLSEDDIFRNEKNYSKETRVPMLNISCDVENVDETFHKIPEPAMSKVEIEDVITAEPDFLNSDSINLMKSELLSSVRGKFNTIIITENEPKLLSVVSKDVVKPEQIHLPTIENLDSSPVTPLKTTFLDINEIIVTEHDRKCENAILDSPVVARPSTDLTYFQSTLPLPGRQKLEIPTSEKSLLTIENKERLLQRLWQSEKYCDEIQASRIPEPELSTKKEGREQPIEQSKRVLKVKTDTSTGTSDLKLNWEIFKYTEQILDWILDPCKLVIPKFCEESSICNEPINYVETIEKFTSRDMYDWKDNEISLQDVQVDKKTAAVGHESCLKAKKITSEVIKEPLSIQTCSDPLGDFMALRSKMAAIKTIKPKEENLLCDPNCHEQENNHVDDNIQVEDIVKVKQNVESKKRMKHHVVEIMLSEDYQQILCILESASENPINVLKQSGDISQSFIFKNITPDVSRYLLKQKEKSLADNVREGSSDELYKMTVILHGLVLASEITENYCLESAIGCLSALQEKYNHIIGSALDDTRQTLFELKAKFYEKKIYHPKVVALCREIETWLKKKRAKTKDSDQKILVLVQRDMPSLLNCLSKALNLSNLLSPCMLQSSESEHIIESLDKHNCVIAPTKMVCDNFPWAQFSLVVEYENETSSHWQQLCERQHIRHIGLCIQSEKRKTLVSSDSSNLTSEYPEQQICLIGSQKVVQNIELLQLLESRHNILLIERDYGLVGDTAKHLFFSDIDIDERTAVVLEDMKDLNDDHAVQSLVTKMVALSLKYVTCWLFLFASNKTGSYQYPGHVIGNLGRLQAAVANFVEKPSNFKAKITFCHGCNEVASLVRNISENCMNLSKSKQMWLDRSWLKSEIQQEEKVLLMLPCLSSFSSQLLLQKLSLGRIFKSSVADIQNELPEIPSAVLETFAVLIRSNTGLHLRGEISVEQLDDELNDNTAFTEDRSEGDSKGEKQIVETEMKQENSEVFRDMYVPEDFQRNGVNKIYEVDMQLHSPMNNKPQVTNNPMLHVENHTIETYNKADKNFKELTNNQSEEGIPHNFESKGKNRIIEDTKGNNYHSNEKYEAKNKNCRKDIGKTSNKEVDWECLNSFISKNSRENVMVHDEKYEMRNDKRNDDTCTKQNSRYLNPVEKLTAMRGRDMLKQSERDERKKYNHENVQNQSNRESQYFREPNVNYCKNISKRGGFTGLEAASYLKNLNSNVEHVPFEKHGRSKFDIDSEMYANRIDSKKKPMSHEGEVQADLYTSRVGHLLHAEQSWTSKSKETFDYNHGLPFRNDPPTDNVWRRDSTASNKNSDFERNHHVHVRNSRSDLEKEFPPSDEIDRSIYVEQMSHCKENSLFFKHPSTESGGHGTTDKHQYYESGYTSHEGLSVLESSHSNSNTIQRVKHALSTCLDNKFEQNESKQLQIVDPSLINTKKSEFDFRPKKIDYSTGERNTNYEHFAGKDLVVNPKLERITRKPQFLEEQSVRSYEYSTPSLADDLRETTRKLLANSQKFSRFDTHSKRHPLQKVSIGLATPRVRNCKNATEDLQISETDHMMMEQSPWATDDSPPMDLDYENSEMNRIFQNRCETSNRVIFTSETPKKKRKLTYQFVPGKGQTKLVFK